MQKVVDDELPILTVENGVTMLSGRYMVIANKQQHRYSRNKTSCLFTYASGYFQK